MQNHSHENEFCLQVHFHANQPHFHLNGLAPRLASKQRHRGTRKWPIMSNASCPGGGDIPCTQLTRLKFV